MYLERNWWDIASFEVHISQNTDEVNITKQNIDDVTVVAVVSNDVAEVKGANILEANIPAEVKRASVPEVEEYNILVTLLD